MAAPKTCCVRDAAGRTVACFQGPSASAKAKALTQALQRSRLVVACRAQRATRRRA